MAHLGDGGTHVGGENNTRVTTVISKVSDVFVHVGQFLPNASGNRVFENRPVQTLEAALHTMDFAPQSGELIPTQKA